MSKRKFKVGETYLVNGGCNKGNIIEITKINGECCWYNIIKGIDNGVHVFCCYSPYTEYLEPIKNESIVIYRKGKEVIALDKVTGKKAVAKCGPDDEFDFNTGAKLAFDRLLDVEQPKYKEVKRNAKKGEYIKVVNPKNVPDGEYKKGDILKVVDVTCDSNAWYGKGYAKDGRSRYLHDHEYVVLEGYEPPQEEEKDDTIKVGDIVKVVNAGLYYPSYTTWKGLGKYEQNIVWHRRPSEDKKYKVINIAQHSRQDSRTLALIQDTDTTQVFIIDIVGIKKA